MKTVSRCILLVVVFTVFLSCDRDHSRSETKILLPDEVLEIPILQRDSTSDDVFEYSIDVLEGEPVNIELERLSIPSDKSYIQWRSNDGRREGPKVATEDVELAVKSARGAFPPKDKFNLRITCANKGLGRFSKIRYEVVLRRRPQ